LGVGFAGVKGASTRAKGASKVGFRPIYYFLVQREYFIPFCCYLSILCWR
jgi:hypothetical protein